MEHDTGLLGALPPTVLDTVLQYLNLFQLKQIRLSSRGLKQLVDDSSTFVNGCSGKVPFGSVLDRGYEPAVWVRVHQARIKHCTVINVSAWWPRLAGHLSYIYIDHSAVMLAALAEILRHCPNVATLGLHHIRLINPNERAEKYANFRLARLTYFSIGNVHDQIAELIRLVMPVPGQLTNFGCVWNGEPDDDEQMIVDFLEDSKTTMKYLGLSPTEEMLAQIGNFERFNPIAVTLYCSRLKVEHVVDFTRKITNLTRLILEDISLSDAIIREICANLPNLKILNVRLSFTETWKPTFTDVAQNLEYLEVKYAPTEFIIPFGSFFTLRPSTISDFAETPRSPNLKEILLTGIVPKTNFLDYLNQSPNLHSVTLDFNSVNFPTLLRTVPMSKLKELTLRSVSIPVLEGITPNPNTATTFPNLRELTLIHVDIPRATLQSLLTACPNLETVRVLSIATDDDDVRFICQRLTRLKQLELYTCPALTDASIGHMIAYGHALERVHISSCYRVSEAAQRQLKQLGRIWVQ